MVLQTQDSGLVSPTPVSRRQFRLVFAGLMLAMALAALDQNIVSTALPRIVGDLGGLSHLSWVVTAFMLASTTVTPLYGKFSDMYGRKPLFIVAIVIFLFGSALCGLATTMTQLILFRGIQGLGGGGLITLAITTVGDLVSPRERGRYQGLTTGVFAVCSVAGPLLGGVITSALSWRWVFYVNLPLGAVALAFIAVGFHLPFRRVPHTIDYPGVVLLAATTTSLLLVLSWGGVVYPWGSPLILGLAVAAAVFCFLLIRQEGSAAEPLIPPRLFRDRVVAIGILATALIAVAMYTAAIFIPLYFQLVQGVAPAQAGLMMSPLMGGLIVASVLGGRLISRTGRYKIFLVLGPTLSLLALLAMAWLAIANRGFLPMEAALVVLGAALGLVNPTLVVAIQSSVRHSQLGLATSVTTFFRSLGGASGVAAAGGIMAARLHVLLPGGKAVLDQGVQRIAALPEDQRTAIVEAYRHAIATTFFAASSTAALALLCVLLIPERPLRGGRVVPGGEGPAAKA